MYEAARRATSIGTQGLLLLRHGLRYLTMYLENSLEIRMGAFDLLNRVRSEWDSLGLSLFSIRFIRAGQTSPGSNRRVGMVSKTNIY